MSPGARISVTSDDSDQLRTDNPFDTDDTDRILEDETDLRDLAIQHEEDRVVNAVTVNYAGMGTGTGKTRSTEAIDSGSINAFGRQEVILNAPWIQDETTARRLRDSVLDLYNGQNEDGEYLGIEIVDAELRRAEVLGTEFDADLFEKVGIEKADGTQIVGRLFSIEHRQMDDNTRITLGPPSINDMLPANVERQTRHQYNTPRETEEFRTEVDDARGLNVLPHVSQNDITIGTNDTATLSLPLHNRSFDVDKDAGIWFRAAFTASANLSAGIELQVGERASTNLLWRLFIQDPSTVEFMQFDQFIPATVAKRIVNGIDIWRNLRFTIANRSGVSTVDVDMQFSAFVVKPNQPGF